MNKLLLKLLLVDDDEDDYIITKSLINEIKNFDFKIEWVKLYNDALKCACENQYDIILADYRLGEKDGIEFIKELKEKELNIPVILLTGQGDFEIDLLAMKAGASDYLVKGDIDPSIIERSIRYSIERKRNEIEIKQLNDELEKRVKKRTKELEKTNEELEREINDKKKAEKQIENEKKLVASILESTAEGIYGVDTDGKCTFINPSAAKILGFKPKEILGKNIYKFIHYNFLNKKEIEEESPIFKAVKEGETLVQAEEIFVRKDGSVFPALYSCSPLYKDNCISGAVVSIIDITDRKEYEEKIYNLAYKDPLTKLPNRTLLEDRLKQSLAHAKRDGTFVAVLFIDLDRFKNINDSMGHKAGDILLKRVAKRLRSCVRETDTVSRQGGDEFVIILPDLADKSDSEVIANKILNVLSESFKIQDKEIYVTPSIGISMYPNDGDNTENLIMYADIAMYTSKKNGRNTYHFFTQEMNTEIIERLNTEIGLRKAILENELVLYYQPKVDLKTNQIVSVEALMRWKHPIIGVIPPDKFINAAEESGLIEIMGEWAIKTACYQNKIWQDLGLPKISVAVNLSPRQIKPNIIDIVRKTLDETGLDAQYLELELTETDIMKNDELIMPILSEFKKMNVKISIDDFGTGYSSLSRLKELQVDYLKIDKSFLGDEPTADSLSIIKAIIAVAKSLKLKVIAEGVETERQANLLKKFKCDQIQGYFISKPIPSEELIENFLKKKNKEESFLKSKFKMFRY